MWAGGPPNPMTPMRPHSWMTVLRGTGSLKGSGMVSAIVSASAVADEDALSPCPTRAIGDAFIG